MSLSVAVDGGGDGFVFDSHNVRTPIKSHTHEINRDTDTHARTKNCLFDGIFEFVLYCGVGWFWGFLLPSDVVVVVVFLFVWGLWALGILLQFY